MATTTAEPEVNEAKETTLSTCPAGENALESSWTFWFDKKVSRKDYNAKGSWRSNLTSIGSFSSVEGFWRYYVHLKRPSEISGANFYMFRNNQAPMWETFPEGGCWILKIGGNDRQLVTKLWQDLLFATIGEQFEEPDVAGVMLAVRRDCDIISVWNENKNQSVRFNIGEKVKRILGLDATTLIEYKHHKRSMRDKSTYRNATPYVFATTGGNNNSQ